MTRSENNKALIKEWNKALITGRDYYAISMLADISISLAMIADALSDMKQKKGVSDGTDEV